MSLGKFLVKGEVAELCVSNSSILNAIGGKSLVEGRDMVGIERGKEELIVHTYKKGR